MRPKAKPFPLLPKTGPLFALSQSCLFIAVANWFAQGMRGMDAKELSFRVGLEAGVFALLLVTMLPRTSAPEASILAFCVAHTMSWLFNGQLWVCLRYCRLYRRSPAALDHWLLAQSALFGHLGWLDEVLLIGSQGRGRGTATDRSDIDLRLIFPRGFSGWLRTNFLLLALRTEALFRAIPLDLYAYDDLGSLERFDQREPLLPLVDRQGRIRERFAERIPAATS